MEEFTLKDIFVFKNLQPPLIYISGTKDRILKKILIKKSFFNKSVFNK